MKKLLQKTLQTFTNLTKELVLLKSSGHAYRVVSINLDECNNYVATIQVIGKGQVFTMKPEEILANDDLTNLFSQMDIRMLTYLGYLGINSPKYKILAQRLYQNDEKILFAIAERGKRDHLVKTAEEISLDEKMLNQLDQKDAHLVGYTCATEQILGEKLQMQKIQHER